MARGFETHARTVSALTLLSRITGLARDAAMSRIFGVGVAMDAFAFAFMVPNLFRRLFGEGALSSSFLPIYTRLDAQRPEVARPLAWLVLSRTAVMLAALTLLGEAILIAVWPAPDKEAATLSATLVAILLPYMPLVCVVALMGAVLQAHHRFGPTAASPIILNMAIVAAAILPWAIGKPDALGPRTHVVVVAGAVLVAGIVQVAWSALALRGTGVRPMKAPPEARAPFREVITRTVPMALGLGVLQVNTFVDGLIASYPTSIGPTIFGVPFPLEKGAMAAMGFAQRLYEFPLGVFGISVATVIFPLLSRQASDTPAFLESLRKGLRLTVFIGLPASMGLLIVRDQLAAVVFQGGDFTSADSARVGSILAGFAVAIWAYSANQVLTRAFYARGDAMTPVKVSMAMVALNFALNVTLIWTPLNVAGLAWSTAICAILQVVALERLLARRLGRVVDADVRRSWLRTLAATLAMGAITGAVAWWLPDQGSWWDMAGVLVALVTVGAATMLGAAWALRMPEMRWALGRQS
ncbi:MAG: murein biosynthesis integral membrane protein MurJ [Phycisphaerales bacterium]|nr:murein biosynthesis integral membrane protein MurJ [Phycisphaerales bacterium]